MIFRGFFFFFCWTVFFSVNTDAYFGLTDKTQLSDLWDIDMNAASLATANHMAWEIDSDKPQPSLDYKPIQMNAGGQKPLPVKRKRASKRGQRLKNRKQTRFDSPGQKNLRLSAKNLKPKQLHRQRSNNYRNQNRWKKEKTSNNKQNTDTNVRLPNSLNRRRPLHRQSQSNSSSDHNSTDHNEKEKERSLKTNHQDAELTKGLEILMGKTRPKTHSIPRIRNERESGKRRDLVGVSRKTQQYLISSSLSDSLSPSQVRILGGMEKERELNFEKDKEKQNVSKLPTSNNDTNPRKYFFHMNENILDSRSSFFGSKTGNATNLIEPQKIDKKEARKLCDSFKLTTYQRRKCKKDPGLPQVLAKATQRAAAECMYQFRYERWNCSLGTSRIHLLNRGNKETAFLYSISSAGLTHSVARACAEGHLESCSCEETFSDHVNQEAWLWGGCGDNVNFAAKFVKRFLKSRGNPMDVRAEIDRHNSDLGIRFVKSNVHQTCKCHGVSGSCTTKSCWRKMAPFYEIGRKIKRAYDRAVKVENTSNTSGSPELVRIKTRQRRQKPRKNRRKKGTKRKNERSSKHQRKRPRTRSALKPTSIPRPTNKNEEAPRKKELVYLEKSPRYCRKTKYSLGTKGRICGKESNCKRMCCGRGYTTHVRIIRRSCECQVKWCCYVQCKTCNERKQIRTCK